MADCVQNYYLSKKIQNYRQLLRKSRARTRSTRNQQQNSSNATAGSGHSVVGGVTIKTESNGVTTRQQKEHKNDPSIISSNSNSSAANNNSNHSSATNNNNANNSNNSTEPVNDAGSNFSRLSNANCVKSPEATSTVNMRLVQNNCISRTVLATISSLPKTLQPCTRVIILRIRIVNLNFPLHIQHK